MSLKLNTESMAGQMLSMAANQASGKGGAKGEDFEQMLLQMSTAQDDLVAGASQNTQKPADSQSQQTAASNKQSNKQTETTGQKTDKVDKAANGQSSDSQTTQAAAGEEPVEAMELAAMLAQGMPVILNISDVSGGEQVQTVNVVAQELAPMQVVNQGIMPQQVQQANAELTGQGEQPNSGVQQEVLGALAAVADGAEATAADTKQFGSQLMQQGMGQTVAEDEPETEVLQAGGQVFEELQAAPVKVAEAKPMAQTVQPEAADGAEQIAQHIQQALQAGDSTVKINLNPANLGSLTVEIARLSDGTLSVILSAVTEKAAGLLEKHSAGLQTLLMNNTQGQVRVEVENRMSDQPTQQFLNPEGDNAKEQHQQQQQQREQHEAAPQDFLQQLRLGLISLEQAV